MMKHFARNLVGNDYAVGDIHGCFDKLQDALEAIGFDTSKDRLFSVGDLVDRGPQSDDVTEWLKLPWFHAVSGNHEDMAMRWPEGNMDSANYLCNGGGWMIANPRARQVEIADALSVLPLAIEVDTANGPVGLVHADCPDLSWTAFTTRLKSEMSNKARRSLRDVVMWDRTRIESMDDRGVTDVHAVLVGHTPVRMPVALGNVLHIDTRGWRSDGYFTLININTMEVLNQPQ